MIKGKILEDLLNYVDDEKYKYINVLVDDKKYVGVQMGESWYLLPVIEKWGNDFLKSEEAQFTTKEHLDSLPKW